MIILLTFLSLLMTNITMTKPDKKEKMQYLALGDSYTIGESVSVKSRWPNQLARMIDMNEDRKIRTTIIAKTGWTTDELIEAVSSADLAGSYDLVSLLIGVNNQYRGYEIDQYKEEFEQLLLTSMSLVGKSSDKVFVLSIPDYGVTPFAKDSNKEKIASEIDEYNRIAKEICLTYKVKFIDITEISRLAVSDASLVASDGLHPSAIMYEKWVEKALPVVQELLW